ncbi:hypothetical protein FPRO04_14040 [Fusarium proliferatum]|uniref:Uncharacterized protein n=1 Tax=Fusarium oxysporum f. sp. radicis-cucumerinum TaxID=327505 RepID=A0A2H3GLD7_FUSOX|nr:hypothetical protein FPRO04_14040 [Fusarium proliferatum]PCD25879.1 hypothetical protein AU210_012313 [Fusarium oxysporum f. sp. radicis-cucumerinum]
MGRRAVTNPNKIESERERARNRRFLKRQMQQTLVREECSGHRGVRMVDPTCNLVSLEDASRHNARPVSNIAGPSIYQVRVPIFVSVSTAHGSAVSAAVLDNRVSSNLTFRDATDPRVIPSFTNQPRHLQYGTEQAAGLSDVSPGLSLVPQTAPLEFARVLTRQRVRKFRDRLHRSRILPAISSTESGSSEFTNRRHRATTGTFGSLASVQRPFMNGQADVEDSSVETTKFILCRGLRRRQRQELKRLWEDPAWRANQAVCSTSTSLLNDIFESDDRSDPDQDEDVDEDEGQVSGYGSDNDYANWSGEDTHDDSDDHSSTLDSPG